MTPFWRGRCLLLVAALLWAIETSLFALSSEKYGALQFIVLRNILIVIYASFWLVSKKQTSLLKVSKRQILPLFIVALASGVFADFGFYYALTYVPIVNGLVIGHLQPFFMLLFGFMFFHEQPLSRAQIIGGTIMFFASLLVSSGTMEELMAFRFGVWQNFIILGSAVLWAGSAVLVKHYLTDLNPTVVVFYRYFLAASTMGIFLLFTDTIMLPDLFVVVNALAVFTGICFWFLGLRVLPAPEVGFLELFSPLFGLAIAAIFVAQQPTVFQIIGCLLMFVGFAGLIKEKQATKQYKP